MKPIIISFPTIFLFFVALTADFGQSTLVLDTDGSPVLPNLEYFILAATHDAVLVPGNRGLTICPPDVLVAPQFIGKGVPVKFSPMNPIGVIPESFYVNIEFSELLWPCPSSKAWKLHGRDTETKQYFVTTGGETGNLYDPMSWFKIEPFEEAYKLRFCTKDEDSENYLDLCGDIGIYSDAGSLPLLNNDRLALSDTPLKVKFKRNGGIFHGSKKTNHAETM